jgi:hypothetical protein
LEEYEATASYSAILFGPPGTAKTTVVAAIAKRLGWGFVTVDTSTFLRDGLTNVARRISDVFDQLMRLDKVVILFDEIEEFVLDRSISSLTMESRMLTTAMLTKQADLRVIADAAPGDEALVRSFGADIVVPRGDDIAAQIRKVVPQGVDGLAVIIHAGVHGAYECDLIHDAGEVRQQLAHIHAALAVFLEFPLRPHDLAAGSGGIVVFDLTGEFLAIELHQLGFRIKQIHMARAALHKHRNHRLRLAKAVRHLRLEVEMLGRSAFRSGQKPLFLQQRGQGNAADTVGGAVKDGATSFEHGLFTRVGAWVLRSVAGKP